MDPAMWMYLIDVKLRMRIVNATARGVSAVGRTMVMIGIADGDDLLFAFHRPSCCIFLYFANTLPRDITILSDTMKKNYKLQRTLLLRSRT